MHIRTVSRNIWHTQKPTRYFEGACIDTGAEQSVVGKPQAKAYCIQHRIAYKLLPSSTIFQFGDGCYKSLGKLRVRIPIANGSFIFGKIDVVPANIPLLIGLDILDSQGIFANNVDNVLCCPSLGWTTPIIRKRGHLYLCWTSKDILYTKTELIKLHRHFYHPSTDKLMNLIKRASPNQADNATRKLLAEISDACSTCQHFARPPERFKVSIPEENIVFNHELALDLMWLDRKALLHVVDTQTHYMSAAFLKGQTVEDVWEAFLFCWVTLYTGFPLRIRTDQGSAFTSLRWTRRCEAVGTEVRHSGVESHNSMGNGERYHDPLRRVFRKIKEDLPRMKNEIALRLALKACNDTLGPEGLVPSLLVFGCIPRFPSVESSIPAQKHRMIAMQKAKSEMETITAALRIRRALLSKVPRNADLKLSIGDKVKIFRESGKKYIGPFPITRIDGKQIFVLDRDKEVQYSIHQLVLAKEYDKILNGDETIESLYTMTRQFKTSKRAQNPRGDPYQVHITEIIHPADPRCRNAAAKEAKKLEIDNLIKRGTWKITLKQDVPDGSNIIGGMFVITIKDVETEKPIYKARYVMHGHKDREKDLLVHDSTTVCQSSIRMLVSIATMFGFRLWSQDITQAYIQSASPLLRDVYLKPTKELEIPADSVLKLLKPLYGLADSGDYWHSTFQKHIKQDIGMENTAADMSLFFKRAHKSLRGLLATYVDDTLCTGTRDFERDTSKTEQKFETKKREYGRMRFAGTYIESQNDRAHIHQKSYIERLITLELDADYFSLRSVRAQLTWMIHTRPEICVGVNKLSQITEETFSLDSIKEYNKVVKYLKKTASQGILLQKLDPNSLHLRVYSDASFASNLDLSSQLGFIVLLCDRNLKANILHFASYKSKRVTRSVLGSEIYAFADAFDYGFTMKNDLERILGQHIPLQMLTDSKSLFDTMIKCSTTTEKRLMIDISVVREAYTAQEISNVGFVRSPNNPADGMTKAGKCASLTDLITTGKAKFPVESWVLRKTTSI